MCKRDQMHRNKFQAIISQYQAKRFIQSLLPRLQKSKNTSNVNIDGDAKDNYLLALTKASRADFLVTGDEDLWVLMKFNKKRIVQLTEFLKLITE
jgi:putative PIN family toxin of toxin-antitoxin system